MIKAFFYRNLTDSLLGIETGDNEKNIGIGAIAI